MLLPIGADRPIGEGAVRLKLRALLTDMLQCPVARFMLGRRGVKRGLKSERFCPIGLPANGAAVRGRKPLSQGVAPAGRRDGGAVQRPLVLPDNALRLRFSTSPDKRHCVAGTPLV